MKAKNVGIIGFFIGVFMLINPVYAHASVDNSVPVNEQIIQLVKRLQTLIKLMEELKEQMEAEKAVEAPVEEPQIEEEKEEPEPVQKVEPKRSIYPTKASA